MKGAFARLLHFFLKRPSVDRTCADDIGSLHSEWMALANKGLYHKAIEQCLANTKGTAVENNFAVVSFLGYAYHQMQEYETALTHLTVAVNQQPDSYYANYFLASTHSALGNKTNALRYFTHAWGLDADQKQSLQRAISLAVECKDSVEAANFISKLKKWVDGNNSSEIYWQTLLLQLGRFDDLSRSLSSSSLSETSRPQLRRISAVSAWVPGHKGIYNELGNPENIRIVYPSTGGADPKETVTCSNTPYIAELPEVTIVGGSSLIFDASDGVLSDTLADPQYGQFVSLKNDEQVIAQHPDALLIKYEEVRNTIPEGIMLSGLFSNHYGHWFAEFLPRLFYFTQHPRFSDIPIIVDEGMPSSHYEFLHAIAQNSLHVLSKGERLKVERLLVAPTITFCPVELFPGHAVPAEHQGSWTESALRFIRRRVLDYYGDSPQGEREKVFLSRKNSSWRCLENEAEIIGVLQPLGFKVVFLEDYSFEEQVRIFQSAEFIVAPNGSSLNSLIFASFDVKMLVLSQEEQFNWGGWFGPMMGLGYRPQLLTGSCLGHAGNKHDDYTIEPKRVLHAVADLERLR
ncbi:Protein of unknown function (DUF563) [Mariprofundus aestuarium]|uniref:Glycosyltransferase 61 catalytic domain-containing protein n=1 Tax=Mariprofundus aestuarium TaxID=1921086 RepID=A0A2K8KZS0_MARES|nr:glycosyltransferase 61 family protein [Mariprofundus aestuarium]ATX80292.1 Protein of unknown function (DUF563) [Mariprofundus aestuarium]